MLAYNSYASPNLDGLSPFELVFRCKPNILSLQEPMPDVPVMGTFKEYYANLQEKLKYLRDHLVSFRDKRVENLNHHHAHHGYFIGQIVYAFVPGGAAVQTGSQKVRICWVGPLIISNCMSINQF